MPRLRALVPAVIAAGLLSFVPSASADITVSASGDTVTVTGDASAERVHIQDGNLSDPAGAYAFAFYVDGVDSTHYFGDASSTCGVDPAGVTTVYCGDA